MYRLQASTASAQLPGGAYKGKARLCRGTKQNLNDCHFTRGLRLAKNMR
jgi:hypothetical protein